MYHPFKHFNRTNQKKKGHDYKNPYFFIASVHYGFHPCSKNKLRVIMVKLN